MIIAMADSMKAFELEKGVSFILAVPNHMLMSTITCFLNFSILIGQNASFYLSRNFAWSLRVLPFIFSRIKCSHKFL